MPDNLVQTVLTFFSGTAFMTLAGYLFARPKMKAEAATKRAEGDGIDVSTQTRIIDGWVAYAERLEARLTAQEQARAADTKRIDAFERREHLISLHVFSQTLWQQKAYLVMHEEQRTQVGPPPVLDPHIFDPESLFPKETPE